MKALRWTASAIGLAASGALLGHGVLMFDLPTSAVRASADVVVPTEASVPAAPDDVGPRTGIENPEAAPPPAAARVGTVTSPTEVPTEATAPVDPRAPVRITIPSIAVDAPVRRVTLAADGSMDVPKRPFDTVWYGLGPRPGETGSAVIAGHVDWVDGTTAVFADLHKVRPGDTIVVKDGEGSVVSFVVRNIRKYAAAADATEVFVSNDGKAHLNLITCAGAWDKSAGQYAERLVVFADREQADVLD